MFHAHVARIACPGHLSVSRRELGRIRGFDRRVDRLELVCENRGDRRVDAVGAAFCAAAMTDAGNASAPASMIAATRRLLMTLLPDPLAVPCLDPATPRLAGEATSLAGTAEGMAIPEGVAMPVAVFVGHRGATSIRQ
jgi:hypothetical protein